MSVFLNVVVIWVFSRLSLLFSVAVRCLFAGRAHWASGAIFSVAAVVIQGRFCRLVGALAIGYARAFGQWQSNLLVLLSTFLSAFYKAPHLLCGLFLRLPIGCDGGRGVKIRL
ncbi:hypothetical protein QSV34_12400 [Porticoccus sp. W117]|uniref:hypothetical protein n=1 Tax=Porticoccus sp. W117 TaxID=3054777 RepID=UPI002599EC3D|nr:hypothetical protein [Porticoccus sp. W117]MDM3872147.1 hypothetical protein [Porticoccus sp. W117]